MSSARTRKHRRIKIKYIKEKFEGLKRKIEINENNKTQKTEIGTRTRRKKRKNRRRKKEVESASVCLSETKNIYKCFHLGSVTARR